MTHSSWVLLSTQVRVHLCTHSSRSFRAINLKLGTDTSLAYKMPIHLGDAIKHLEFWGPWVQIGQKSLRHQDSITMRAIKLKLDTDSPLGTHLKSSNKILQSAVGIWNFLHLSSTSCLRRWAYYAPPCVIFSYSCSLPIILWIYPELVITQWSGPVNDTLKLNWLSIQVWVHLHSDDSVDPVKYAPKKNCRPPQHTEKLHANDMKSWILGVRSDECIPLLRVIIVTSCILTANNYGQ